MRVTKNCLQLTAEIGKTSVTKLVLEGCDNLNKYSRQRY